jgi:hypothetical protein
MEEVNHLRHTEENKRLYALRKETIERVFADAKEKHGMRWTTLRGLEKVSMQAMLTFASMNLKKLATWLWKSGGSKHKIRDFVLQMVKIYNKLPSRQKETREFVFSLPPPFMEGIHGPPRLKSLRYN